MRALFTYPILLVAATAAFAADTRAVDTRAVLFAASRSGRIEAYEPSTLQLLGSIGVNHGVESISVSPDGRALYIAQENLRAAGVCCGLYTLSLETHNMCGFGVPATFAAPSADGLVFTQHDDERVQVFDAATLRWLGHLKAGGPYNLQPSPEGRWLFGITNSPKPALDIFDPHEGDSARRLAIPSGPATGAWAGSLFHIFSYSPPGNGELWSLHPGDSKLSAPKQIHLPDLHGACNEPVLLMLAGAPERLFLAEAYGYKLDRRSVCPDGAPGGIYVIEPSSGHVDVIARNVHVNRMVAGPEGRDLFVLESGAPNQAGSVHLLRIDASSGSRLANVTLESGEWSLALAHIPYRLLPRGYLRAAHFCAPATN